MSRRLVSASLDGTVLVWDLTGTRSAMNAQPLTVRELENVWSDLSSADGVRGQKAVRGLSAVPDQAVTLLANKLKPTASPNAKLLARCLMELDSELFKAREGAMRELEKMGDVAVPAIQKALAGDPSLELKKRMESLLESFSGAQRVRTLRAVQALEQMGTASSQALLERLSAGVDSLLTREAKAALESLGQVTSGENLIGGVIKSPVCLRPILIVRFPLGHAFAQIGSRRDRPSRWEKYAANGNGPACGCLLFGCRTYRRTQRVGCVHVSLAFPAKSGPHGASQRREITMRTAYGYVRVSSEDQADSGLGLEAQRQRIRAFCESKGLHLAGILDDRGVSGAKPFPRVLAAPGC